MDNLFLNGRKIKGFTLVEIMIVMAVVAILSGLVITVINPTQLRARSRDATRIADLKKIQTALELRFTDFRNYPSSPSWQSVSVSLSAPLAGFYNGPLPTDPNGNSAAFACANNFLYSYRSTNGSNYVLVAKMETTGVDYVPCSAVSNCLLPAYACNCTAANRCHGVQNPF